MGTLNDYLPVDDKLIIKLGIVSFYETEVREYQSICGTFIDSVEQWCSHNIDSLVQSENDYYTGWTIQFENFTILQIYISNKILDLTVNDFNHAKNLFIKNLKRKV